MDSRLRSFNLKCVSAPMSYFGIENGFGSITVTEWPDANGYDIEYGGETISLSADLVKAIRFLTDYMALDVPEM